LEGDNFCNSSKINNLHETQEYCFRSASTDVSRYNQHVIRGRYVAVVLFIASCSMRNEPDKRDLPPIPKLAMAAYSPKLRVQVEKAYAALEQKPDDADANGSLGMLLHAFEQLDSAEVCYRRAHRLDPKRFQWAYYLGIIQALGGKNAEASANLQDAIRIDPGYVPARLKLVEVLLGLGQFDESRRICESILKENPQVAPAYYWLGRIAAENGQIAEAEENYRKACELWPTYGTAHYALALAYRKSGDAPRAKLEMASYQKYRADNDPQPEDPMLEAVRALDNSALAHLMKGVDLENAGQIEQALAEHEEAVRQDPKLVQALANLISLYARTGQPEKTERTYRAIVAINPNLPQSHYDYGVFMVSRGRFPEAESAFREALKSSPNYAEAHSNLGAMLERKGKVDQAAREYQAAIDNKPNFRQAHYQLGHLLLMQKKTKDAIAQLSQTLTPEDANTPRFMFALAMAYAEESDYRSAERYLQQAAQRASALGQSQLTAQIETILPKIEQRTSK
jgi:tetratricopeptide (TPR) repeat protein